MKKLFPITIAGLMFVTSVRAESAHKGWGASPAQRPSATSIVRDVGMTGPSAAINEPDPPTNGIFHGGYLYKTGSIVAVQRVYMLVPNEDGTIKTKEVRITPPSLLEKEAITGYYSASFRTEEVSFKEG